MKFHFNSELLARQAIIAAIYCTLTLSGLGFSYGPIQFRYSEVLNWLAFFDPKNIIGLTLGCFVSNIFSPYGVLDMVIGTLGTLLATYCMSKSKNMITASVFPAAFSFLYSGEAVLLGEIPQSLFLIDTLKIMLSEIIIVAVIGIPLVKILNRSNRLSSLFVDSKMKPIKNM